MTTRHLPYFHFAFKPKRFGAAHRRIIHPKTPALNRFLGHLNVDFRMVDGVHAAMQALDHLNPGV